MVSQRTGEQKQGLQAEPIGKSLGARLAEQNHLRELEHLTAQQVVSPEAMERARKHKAAVKAAFDGLKVQIASAIDANEPLRPIRLPPVFQFGGNHHELINSPRHTDNHLYLEFQTWLSENGLAGRLRMQEDGGGMDSWHVLTIIPAIA